MFMEHSYFLMNELSFPLRAQILEELFDNPLKLNDLAVKFDIISKSEISRHLSRLLEIKIITKDNSSHNYSLTPLGEAYIFLSFPLRFVLNLHSFFEQHFIDLPPFLFKSIDCLSEAKLIVGSGEVLTSTQEILQNTEQKTQILLDQKFPLTLNKQINSGKYIVSPSMREKGAEYVKKSYKDVEFRGYNQIKHNMLISDDKIGILCFSSLNHIVDISSCFKVIDETGLNFLQSIWDYYWNLGEKLTLPE